MTRVDPAWDKLVEVTRSNPVFERGRIAIALKAIKECCKADGILDEDVPAEIAYRADCYRKHFRGIELTPTALARHWYRVLPMEGGSFGTIVDRYTRGDDDRRGG